MKKKSLRLSKQTEKAIDESRAEIFGRDQEIERKATRIARGIRVKTGVVAGPGGKG